MIWLNNKIENVATALAYSFAISLQTSKQHTTKTKEHQMTTTNTYHHTNQKNSIHKKFKRLEELKQQENNIKQERKAIQDNLKRQFQLEDADTGKHLVLDSVGDIAGCITKTSVESKFSIVTSDKEHFTKILSLCSHILQMANIKPSKESFRYTFKWTN